MNGWLWAAWSAQAALTSLAWYWFWPAWLRSLRPNTDRTI